MQNKKLLFTSVLVFVVSAAAFIGGRFLNQGVDAVRLGAPFTGDFRSMIVPAPELPITPPEVIGPFVERQDDTVIVEVKSFETTGFISTSRTDTKSQHGPMVEVVVMNKTMIYRETTQPSVPLSAENQTIQQTVEQATLDDLDSQSMIMVWGRRSGDRIIADVLMYSDLVSIKGAIFKDCEICP